MGALGVNFVALGFVHDVDINLFSFKNLMAYHFEFISLAGMGQYFFMITCLMSSSALPDKLVLHSKAVED